MNSISIIVCTLNRPESLHKTLDSISIAISHSAQEIQVVIVDNGSTKETFYSVRSWANKQPFRVKTIYEARKGLSIARNTGLRTADGDLLVFTDDDCRLSPDYFTALVGHYSGDTVPVMRGGRVELGDATDLPFTIKTDPEPDFMNDVHFPGGFLIGANMIIPRAIIDKVGRFDERFGAGAVFKAAEDTDYVLRAHRAGFQIEYQPDIVVSHYHGRKDSASISKLYSQYNIGNGALYAKHRSDKKLLMHLVWDIRKCIMRKPHNKELGLSYSSIIVGNIKGALLYALHAGRST